MVVTVEDPVRGDYQMTGCPIKLSDQKSEVGERTAEVLTSILGCTPEEVIELREQGVV